MLKELYQRQKYNKQCDISQLNIYDVLHTLNWQQLQKEIKQRVEKSILKFVNGKKDISKQRLDEIYEYIQPMLIQCFKELIDICRQKNIALHFVNMPVGIQTKKNQEAPYVVSTQLYQKQFFNKWIESQQQKFKQIFLYEFFVAPKNIQENGAFPNVNTIQLNKLAPYIRYYASTYQI